MALSVAACQSPAATDEATAPATVAAPGTVAVPEVEQPAPIVASAVVDQHASPWEHVRTKYDADGDGVVSIEEYDRDGVQFAQLDLDNDGKLSTADFSRELSPTAPMLRMRIFRVLANYFQTDEDPSKFSMGELAEAFGIYDEDGDGAIAAEEFSAHAAERRRALLDEGSDFARVIMADIQPFEELVAELDEDGDGALNDDELITFFEARDEQRSGVLALPVAQEAERSGGKWTSGALAGEPAPDFTLEPPDGGAQTTLSSFRGSKPVALIFGSYT